jgi:hypothetical protein
MVLGEAWRRRRAVAAEARRLLQAARSHDKLLSDLARFRAAHAETDRLVRDMRLRGEAGFEAAEEALSGCRAQIEHHEALLAHSHAAITQAAVSHGRLPDPHHTYPAPR